MASNFDKVRWTQCKISWIPALPATAGGDTAMYFDMDRADPGATTVTTAMQNKSCVIAPIWAPNVGMTLSAAQLRSGEWFSTTPTASGDDVVGDNTFTSPGRFHVVVTPVTGLTGSTAVRVGHLSVAYTVLFGPLTTQNVPPPTRVTRKVGADTSSIAYTAWHVAAFEHFSAGCFSRRPDFYQFMGALLHNQKKGKLLELPKWFAERYPCDSFSRHLRDISVPRDLYSSEIPSAVVPLLSSNIEGTRQPRYPTGDIGVITHPGAPFVEPKQVGSLFSFQRNVAYTSDHNATKCRYTNVNVLALFKASTVAKVERALRLTNPNHNSATDPVNMNWTLVKPTSLRWEGVSNTVSACATFGMADLLTTQKYRSDIGYYPRSGQASDWRDNEVLADAQACPSLLDDFSPASKQRYTGNCYLLLSLQTLPDSDGGTRDSTLRGDSTVWYLLRQGFDPTDEEALAEITTQEEAKSKATNYYLVPDFMYGAHNSYTRDPSIFHCFWATTNNPLSASTTYHTTVRREATMPLFGDAEELGVFTATDKWAQMANVLNTHWTGHYGDNSSWKTNLNQAILHIPIYAADENVGI